MENILTPLLLILGKKHIYFAKTLTSKLFHILHIFTLKSTRK